MNIDKAKALRVLTTELLYASADKIDPKWAERIRQFCLLAEASSRTHIAFLGTVLLAKSVAPTVDVYIVKAREGSAGAYSARSLAHGVLVPFSVMHGIDLGASGREPLNNQPYFRISRVTEDIPIHENARAAFNALWSLLPDIAEIKSEQRARELLRTFLFVRKTVRHRVAMAEGASVPPADKLARLIDRFVQAYSEGGKRAQACVAGLMDIYAGADAVAMDRVNAPDKHGPGGVSVRSRAVSDAWDKAIEVRDKPVSEADLMFFVRKVAAAHGTEAIVVAVSPSQSQFATLNAKTWALEHGVQLSVYWGWTHFVHQAMLWSDSAGNRALIAAPEAILKRLQELEVSQEGVNTWKDLFES